MCCKELVGQEVSLHTEAVDCDIMTQNWNKNKPIYSVLYMSGITRAGRPGSATSY